VVCGVNALGWRSGERVDAQVAGVHRLCGCAVREYTAPCPKLRIGLFGRRSLSIPNAVGYRMSAGMFGSLFLLTLCSQNVQHGTPLEAGLKTMPWTGTIMAVAPVAGIIAGRIGPRVVVTAGMAAQAAALIWIGAVAQASTPYLDLLPAFVLGGIGMGLTFSPLSAAVMASASGAL